MEPVSDMWLVVHVPKTAGTSFRQALEQYFGPDRVIRDYGRDAETTTKIVQDYLYRAEKPKSPAELVQAISDDSKKILVGHFPVRKYAGYFAPQNIICFVRDPLIRTCSEYLHRMRNSSFDGTFCDFISKPGIKNIQSRFLQGIPEESVIGLTEHYRESLIYINDFFKFKLNTLRRNVDRKGGGQKFAENLSKHELDLFYKLNEKDQKLYDNALHGFSALDIQKSTFGRFLSLLK
jgi:hypothetical protein